MGWEVRVPAEEKGEKGRKTMKNAKEHECPRYWDKYKVCSDENPHECEHFIEMEMKT